ncbi:sigma factor, partial [Pseudomonas syringae group genomosp. 7]
MAVPAASSTALAGFYREHHGWLLGWLRRRTHNADCAADLTQDTFLRLLSRRVDPSELRLPRAYLSTIAHALLVNHWQRADLERAYLTALAAQPEPVHPSAEERTQALQ